ncbi:MAG: carboxypeptidase regulatory-like domain-containing protein, partial [Ruminiclostridium sp.]|nr:carboxypeptidase regulatory-like domain-containing protein [Ruminiclostridium sp.]
MKIKAQDKEQVTLSGRILDQTNNPVSGVMIRIKGETSTILTSKEGIFTCEYEKGRVIMLT